MERDFRLLHDICDIVSCAECPTNKEGGDEIFQCWKGHRITEMAEGFPQPYNPLSAWT
jgi:hypothetical protein